jgi:hypothetical protein
MFTIAQLGLFGVALLLLLSLFYEAAARTNMRRLMRFGLPLLVQTAVTTNTAPLLDHLPLLMERLNPAAEPVSKRSIMAQLFQPTAVPAPILLLPVTEEEMVFRQGYATRGRLVRQSGGSVRLLGFFTWPSLFVPIALLFVGSFFPIMLLALLAYICLLILEQRHKYRWIAQVVVSVIGNQL